MVEQPRRSSRHTVFLTAEVLEGDELVSGIGRIVNLSEGGACIESILPLPKGKSLSIVVRFDDRTRLSFNADVRWVELKGRGFRYGLQFSNASSEDLVQLRRAWEPSPSE